LVFAIISDYILVTTAADAAPTDREASNKPASANELFAYIHTGEDHLGQSYWGRRE